MYLVQDCGPHQKYRSNAIIKDENQVQCKLFKTKSGLRVCQKSSMISKHSCSRIRISQQTAEFESCIQSCQDVSSSNEVSTQDIESNEAVIDQPGTHHMPHQQAQQLMQFSILKSVPGFLMIQVLYLTSPL